MARRAVLLACLAALSVGAQAEDFAAFPPDTPAGYRNECGTCHVAFPPGLLSRDGWRDTMDGLARHFGDHAALDEPLRREIEDFLVRNAGGERRFGARGEPPRLSATVWFRRTHGEVRPAFRDHRIGGAANCPACHAGAERGRYDKRGLAALARQYASRD